MVLNGLLAFAGATLVLAMSPGPASVLIMRQTLYGGRRIAALSILGIATGLVAWLASACLGLTAVITGHPAAYETVRVVGAVVLGVFGVRTLLASRPGRGAEAGHGREPRNGGEGAPYAPPGPRGVGTVPAERLGPVPGAAPAPAGAATSTATVDPPDAAAARRMRPRTAYQTGLLTCLTNPKVAIFAAALLPQFVSMGTWSGWMVALYGLTWAATSSAWYLFLTVLLSRARWIYERPAVRRWLERISGVVLLGFGLRLAVQAWS